MAEYKTIAPFTDSKQIVGGFRVFLTNDDIEAISDSVVPIQIITGLVPQVGGLIAGTISLQMWAIKRINKKYNFRGVVLTFGPLTNSFLGVWGPDKW